MIEKEKYFNEVNKENKCNNLNRIREENYFDKNEDENIIKFYNRKWKPK